MLFNYFHEINFSQSNFFVLFVLIPLLILWYIFKANKQLGSIIISDTTANGLSSWKSTFIHFPFVLRLITISCIIFALAKPQTNYQLQQNDGEGIDIILCIDVSGSMNAKDFTPNRLEAAKNVATDFVNKRVGDRIGVVIFSGESFTQCPLTTDNTVLLNAIENIHNGLLLDGTSIGSGLGTSVDRLKDSKTTSKIIILLTDGVDNGGYILDPNTAKEIAKAFAIKVYTIGVGTDGYAPTPVTTPFGDEIKNEKVNIDEKLLTQIAIETGGKYFRAKDNESLTNIYNDIDKLEKSKVIVTNITRHKNKFFPFVIAALVFILLEILIKYIVFKKFP